MRLWLVINALVALPFLEKMGRFKIFLNPAAPAMIVALEGLIVLAAWLRYRQLKSSETLASPPRGGLDT